MNVPLTIKAVTDLLQHMHLEDKIANYQIYTSIKVLMDELKLHLKEEELANGNINCLVSNIINCSKYAANLETDHDSPSRHITYANTEIDSLKKALREIDSTIKL